MLCWAESHTSTARLASTGMMMASSAGRTEKVTAEPALQPFSQEGAKDMSLLGKSNNF